MDVSSASTATTTSPASRLPASTAAGSVSTDGFCNDHAHSPLHTAHCTALCGGTEPGRRDGAKGDWPQRKVLRRRHCRAAAAASIRPALDRQSEPAISRPHDSPVPRESASRGEFIHDHRQQHAAALLLTSRAVPGPPASEASSSVASSYPAASSRSVQKSRRIHHQHFTYSPLAHYQPRRPQPSATFQYIFTCPLLVVADSGWDDGNVHLRLRCPFWSTRRHTTSPFCSTLPSHSSSRSPPVSRLTGAHEPAIRPRTAPLRSPTATLPQPGVTVQSGILDSLR